MLYLYLHLSVYYSEDFSQIYLTALIKKSHGIRVQVVVAYFSVLTCIVLNEESSSTSTVHDHPL